MSDPRARLVGLLYRRGRAEFEVYTALVASHDKARLASVRRQMPYRVEINMADASFPPLFAWLEERALSAGRDFTHTGRQYHDPRRETADFYFKSLTEATLFKLRWC